MAASRLDTNTTLVVKQYPIDIGQE